MNATLSTFAEIFKDWGPSDALYILTLLVVVLCLARGHRTGKVNLWDLVTTTDRAGTTRTDARKFFECGVFVVSTVAFSYLVIWRLLTEWYVFIYIGAFVTGRALRDREQRLNRLVDLQGANPEATPKP